MERGVTAWDLSGLWLTVAGPLEPLFGVQSLSPCRSLVAKGGCSLATGSGQTSKPVPPHLTSLPTLKPFCKF